MSVSTTEPARGGTSTLTCSMVSWNCTRFFGGMCTDSITVGEATAPPLPEGVGDWLVTDPGKTTKHGSSLSTLPPGGTRVLNTIRRHDRALKRSQSEVVEVLDPSTFEGHELPARFLECV